MVAGGLDLNSMTNLYKMLKNSKTRTGNNSERCSEEEIEKLIKESEGIRFNNPDVPLLPYPID